MKINFDDDYVDPRVIEINSNPSCYNNECDLEYCDESNTECGYETDYDYDVDADFSDSDIDYNAQTDSDTDTDSDIDSIIAPDKPNDSNILSDNDFAEYKSDSDSYCSSGPESNFLPPIKITKSIINPKIKSQTTKDEATITQPTTPTKIKPKPNTIENYLINNKIITNPISYEFKYGKYKFSNLPNFNYTRTFTTSTSTTSKQNDIFKCFDTTKLNCLVIHDEALFEQYYPNLKDKLFKSTYYFINPINELKENKFAVILIYLKNVPNDIQKKGCYASTLDNKIIFEILIGKGSIYRPNDQIKINPIIDIDYNTININVNSLQDKNNSYYKCLNPYTDYSPYKHLKFIAIPNDYVNHTHLGMTCKHANKSPEEKKKINHVCEKKSSGSYHYPNNETLYKFIAYAPQSERDMFCISEKVGEYFIFFVDLDLDDDKWLIFKENDPKLTSANFWGKIISVIVQTLKDNITPKNINNSQINSDHYYDYIYSQKMDKENKIHLYFPHIIINATYARAIREICIGIICGSIGQQSKHQQNWGDLIKNYITKIYDNTPYTGSLRLLYQRKCGDKQPYDLIPEKSTYVVPDSVEYNQLIKTKVLSAKKNKRLSEIRFNYLKLVSVNQGHNEINFDIVGNENNVKMNPVKSYCKKSVNKNTKIVVERKGDLVTETIKYCDNDDNEIEDKHLEEVTEYTKYNFKLSMIAHKRPTHMISYKFIKDLVYNLSRTRLINYSTWRDLMFFCKHYGLRKLAHEISQLPVPRYNVDGEDFNRNENGEIILYNADYDPIKVDNILNEHQKCDLEKNYCECKIINFYTLLKWSREDNEINHNVLMSSEYAGTITKKSFKGNNCFAFIQGLKKFKYINNLENYNAKYMREYPINKKISFIKGGLGCGKTTQMTKYLQEILKIKGVVRTIIISSRRTLTLSLKRSVCDTGINCKHYRDADINFYTDEVISITPDSLTKYADVIKEFNDFGVDAVIIDEVESLLNYVSSSTTISHSRKEIFEILCRFMRSSKKILLMDGHLNHVTINFVMNILAQKDDEYNYSLKDSMQIIYNSNYEVKRQYLLLRRQKFLYNILLKQLEEKKKVYICTDSLTESNVVNGIIEGYFKDKKYKPVGTVYNGDSSDKHKDELANCNEHWVKFDYVIVSPTVVYGLDFSVKNYFDTIFSINCSVFRPNSVHQQICRVRYPKSSVVYIYAKKKLMTENRKAYFWEKYNKFNNDMFKYSLFKSETFVKKTKLNTTKLSKISKTNDTPNNSRNIIDTENLSFDEKLALINQDVQIDLTEKITDKEALDRFANNYDFNSSDIDESEVLDQDPYLYDTNELSRMLDDYQYQYCNFMDEQFYSCLGNYLCEYDGVVFDHEHVEFDKKSFKSSLIKLVKDNKKNFNEEQIKSIIEGSKRANEYESIIKKPGKTTEENFTILGTNILWAFNLKKLDESLFKKYSFGKQIYKFIDSVQFSMNDKSLKAQREKRAKMNFESINQRQREKTELIRKLLFALFDNGLIDDSVCIVNSNPSKNTDKQKAFINEYFYENGNEFVNKVKKLFPTVAQSVNYKNDVDKITSINLMHWLQVIVKLYFGYSIKKIVVRKINIIKSHFSKGVMNVPWELLSCNNTDTDFYEEEIEEEKDEDKDRDGDKDKCERKEENKKGKNKEDQKKKKGLIRFGKNKNTYDLYCYKQEQIHYLELLLVSKFEILTDSLRDSIFNKYGNTKCEFSQLHNYKNFKTIFNTRREMMNLYFGFDFDENDCAREHNKKFIKKKLTEFSEK